MSRSRTGSVVVQDGRYNARITYMGTDGKRHAIWRAARDEAHAQQLIPHIAELLGHDKLANHHAARQKHGFVYAVQMVIPNNECPIKIGFAVEVKNRIDNIATSCPYPLRVIGYWETWRGDLEEHEIHKLFAETRMTGEWFKPTPELISLVRTRAEKYRAILERRSAELQECDSLCQGFVTGTSEKD